MTSSARRRTGPPGELDLHLLDTGRHDRLGQRRHPDEADAVDTVGCVERHDRAPEPQPCGLGQPPLGVRHLADLTGEADLAEHHDIGCDRLRRQRADDREAQREVGAGFGQPDPTDR